MDSDNDIAVSVSNIKLLTSIKASLTKLILNDDYLEAVKGFLDVFSTVSVLQNTYFTQIESEFKPNALLKALQQQSITDTLDTLTESGLNANVTDAVTQILRTNITSGGSYKALETQLRGLLTDTDQSDGLLTKYTKQVTTDAINQYSAQYTQAASQAIPGLGEWFYYANSLIKTSRPFCIGLHERGYFHISEIPDLLDGDLTYTNPKTGEVEDVPIYAATGLPQGMYSNENEDNFLVLRGGYNCGHQCAPVSENLVPPDIVARVKGTAAYSSFKNS